MLEFNAPSQFIIGLFLTTFYTTADGLVFHAKARAFKAEAKATNSRPRPRNFALQPRPRINIPALYHNYVTPNKISNM